MIAIALDVRVPRGSLPKRDLAGFVREACAAIPVHGEVAVLLTTDAAVQELNRSFRRKNKPTDVLSFPAVTADVAGHALLAGDLAVSIDTASRQAAAFGHSLLLEVKILLLHGLLHLAGFDHEQDTGQMRRRERVLRTQFSLPLGLIQRASATVAPARAGTAKPVLGAAQNAKLSPAKSTGTKLPDAKRINAKFRAKSHAKLKSMKRLPAKPAPLRKTATR